MVRFLLGVSAKFLTNLQKGFLNLLSFQLSGYLVVCHFDVKWPESETDTPPSSTNGFPPPILGVFPYAHLQSCCLQDCGPGSHVVSVGSDKRCGLVDGGTNGEHVQKSGKHVAHHPRDFFWCHLYNATVTARGCRRPHGKHCAK